MPHPAFRSIRRRIGIGAFIAVLAIGTAACGGGKADISKAVDAANEQLKTVDVKLSCPDEVDQDAQFDCTVQGTKTGKTATIKANVAGENKDTLTPVDQTAYQKSIEEVIR